MLRDGMYTIKRMVNVFTDIDRQAAIDLITGAARMCSFQDQLAMSLQSKETVANERMTNDSLNAIVVDQWGTSRDVTVLLDNNINENVVDNKASSNYFEEAVIESSLSDIKLSTREKPKIKILNTGITDRTLLKKIVIYIHLKLT